MIYVLKCSIAVVRDIFSCSGELKHEIKKLLVVWHSVISHKTMIDRKENSKEIWFFESDICKHQPHKAELLFLEMGRIFYVKIVFSQSVLWGHKVKDNLANTDMHTGQWHTSAKIAAS